MISQTPVLQSRLSFSLISSLVHHHQSPDQAPYHHLAARSASGLNNLTCRFVRLESSDQSCSSFLLSHRRLKTGRKSNRNNAHHPNPHYPSYSQPPHPASYQSQQNPDSRPCCSPLPLLHGCSCWCPKASLRVKTTPCPPSGGARLRT